MKAIALKNFFHDKRPEKYLLWYDVLHRSDKRMLKFVYLVDSIVVISVHFLGLNCFTILCAMVCNIE